jgi:hypothetical protein
VCVDTVEQIIHNGMDHFYLHGLNDHITMPALWAGITLVNVGQRFDSLYTGLCAGLDISNTRDYLLNVHYHHGRDVEELRCEARSKLDMASANLS